jgi:O-antigen/teichoic acid export membrane protein
MYGRAYQLINIPTENLNSASGGVAFAALSRLQDDPNRFKNYFLKGYSVVLAMTLPITIACALFANDIILVILGPKWKEAIPIFQLLTPTILVFALINPMWWLLSSMGLLGRSMKIALVIAPLMIAAYVIGLPYGPTGVALAYSAVMTLWLVPHIAWSIHGTMISSRDILKASGQPFLSAIVAAAIAFAVQFFYSQSFSPFPRLLLGSGILLVSYLWMLLYVMGQKDFYLDLLRGLMKRSSVGEKKSVAVL